MKAQIILIFSVFISVFSLSQPTSNPFCANGPTYESAELGFGSYRYHVNWFRFDSAGVYDFSATDIIANIYGNTGIEPIIIFKCTPPIADTSASADTSGWSYCEKELWERIHDTVRPSAETSWFPADTTAWKNFLTAFVQRYNGDGIQDYPNLVHPFKVYQLEVEMTRVWCTNDNDSFPDDYVRYINMSYRTIKEADPDALVKMAGWGSVDIHMFYLHFIDTDSLPINQSLYIKRQHLDTAQQYQENLNKWLYIYNNADYDVFDIHCYGLAEHFPGRAAGLRALFDTAGTKPLWALEGGGPYRYKAEVFNPLNDTGYLSPQLVAENAAYVIRYYVGGIGSGFTRLAWNVVPEYDPWGQEFGDLNLMSINFEKKPSYWVYKGLASFISNYTHAEKIPDGLFWSNPDIVGYEVTTPTKHYIFIWNLKDTATVQLKGINKQHVFPVVMYDSLWHELSYNSNSIYSFNTSRTPLIFEGQLMPTALPLHEENAAQIRVYPNPGTGQFTIEAGDTHISNLQLYSITGAQYPINVSENSNGIYFLNTRNAPAGIYFLKIETNNGSLLKRFIIF